MYDCFSMLKVILQASVAVFGILVNCIIIIIAYVMITDSDNHMPKGRKHRLSYREANRPTVSSEWVAFTCGAVAITVYTPFDALIPVRYVNNSCYYRPTYANSYCTSNSRPASRSRVGNLAAVTVDRPTAGGWFTRRGRANHQSITLQLEPVGTATPSAVTADHSEY